MASLRGFADDIFFERFQTIGAIGRRNPQRSGNHTFHGLTEDEFQHIG